MFYTTLFTVCRDEERFLEEFLRYYLSIGVERIVFVDNNDNEKQKKIVDKISSQKIEYIKDNTKLYGTNRLTSKYMSKLYEKSYWTMFFDRDEFLNLGKFSNIEKMLKKYDDSDLLVLNWKSYASKDAVDKRILINLNKRLKVDKKRNISSHIKSIVKTSKISPHFVNPHCPRNIKKCHNLTLGEDRLSSPKMQINNDDLYVNPHLCHYHYHGLENFIKKMEKPDKKLRNLDSLIRESGGYKNLFEKAYYQYYGHPNEMVEDNTMKNFIERRNLYDKIYSK